MPEEQEREYGLANGDDGPPVQPTLAALKTAQAFVDALKNATLKDSGLDDATIERLKNPIRDIPDLDQDRTLRLALRQFIANHHSEESYRDNRDAVKEFTPAASELPSYERVQKIVEELSGVTPIITDMCVNSCLAYTGPFAELDVCPLCPLHEARYERRGTATVARSTFRTMPWGPQAQALYRSRPHARRMRYRDDLTETLLEMIRKNEPIPVLEDTFYSNDYLNLAKSKFIKPDDMTLMFSIDGAQLYESKQSDCWIYIWVLFDLSPDQRYQKRYVFPGAIIPGPAKPKNIDSFIFPGMCCLTWRGSSH